MGTVLFTVLGVGVVVAAGLVGSVELGHQRSFDVPLPALSASSDPSLIARGKYLFNGPAHCITCHTPNESSERAGLDEAIAPIGGHVWKTPVGTFYSPNLTPDAETGIGRLSDAQIARAMRHGVKHDGQAMLPFMPYQNLSDQDVVAILSYLRQLPPVKNPVPRNEFNFLGKAVKTFVLAPKGPKQAPPAQVTSEPTSSYGEYLATTVANCAGCHTNRNPATGDWIGEPFAGGYSIESETKPGLTFVTPNLTPEPSTGRIAHWSEEAFVNRFRVGAVIEHSPMPWNAYRQMTDDDLRALYRYLRQVKPIKSETTAS